MKCRDCGNETTFHDVQSVMDTLTFEDGVLVSTESGEHFWEGYECTDCGSDNVEE